MTEQCGTAQHFGKAWDIDISAPTPPSLRLGLLLGLYDRGATYFYLWGFHEVDGLTGQEVIDLASSLSSYARDNRPTKDRATIAILIPEGHMIPVGAYYSLPLCKGSDGCKGQAGTSRHGDLWELIPVDQSDTKDPRWQTLHAIGEAIRSALATGEEFDILVSDDALRPGYIKRYAGVVIVKAR